MTDQASSSITINATRADVMGVIADFEAYPEWAGFIKTVEIQDAGDGDRAQQVRFVLDAGVIKADYTLAYDWKADDAGVSWTLVQGSLKQNDGSYALTGDNPTEVTYSLEVDLGVPMLGMFKRKAEKVIMDTALKELKKRVEA